MKRHLTESEKTAMALIKKSESFILLSDDGSGNWRIHQKKAEDSRFILVYENRGDGGVQLNAYGYPSDRVIAHRLTSVLLDLYRKNHGAIPPSMEGKKLILGPDGRIVVDESSHPV